MKTIFTSDVVGHRDIKEFQPQPAKNFMPDWYKKMPSDVQYDTDYKKMSLTLEQQNYVLISQIYLLKALFCLHHVICG